MAAMSDFLEGEVLKHLLRTGTFIKPAEAAMSLASADPGEAGTGASHSELAATGGYTRIARDPLDANWTAVAAGTTDNAAVITFPTATVNWSAVVSHTTVLDESTVLTSGTAANLWFKGALTASKTVNNGDVFQYPTGNVDVQIDN